MRLGKDLIGKPIYTISDGRHIGKVKDIYLDRNLYWMTGLHLGREGIIRRKDNLISREQVVVFGVDAILVRDSEAVTDSKAVDIADWLRLADLEGRGIDTPGGTKLAVLGDVILDTEGRITGFSLAKVTVEGPIAQNRAIGREVVIDNGHEDGVMTIDLVKAEQQGVRPENGEGDPIAKA
jgi:sporulation protein YlmC with PRC-barrel domain